MDVVLTGASRGIGRAFALALPPHYRVHAIARDADALASLAAERPGTTIHVADLASVAEATRIGRALSVTNAMLVHNAGLWPARLEHVEGYERAYAVNVRGPLALQAPLLEAKCLARILVVGAGIMVKGRFDPVKTPRGDDFSWWRTYASTKLAFAAAMREVARTHPEVDVAVVHPGVARTELGDRTGALGWLVRLAKRRWEPSERSAERLLTMTAMARWSPPGDARWFVEGSEQPWPEVVARTAQEAART